MPLPLVAIFVSVTKLTGIIVTVTVAANAISYSRFRKKNLMPIPSPIHDSSDVLAVFNVSPSHHHLDHDLDGDGEGEKRFFFGLATAPAHVEDTLNDAWLEFAEKSPCDKSEPQHNSLPSDPLLASASASADGGSGPTSLPPKESNRTFKRKKPLKIAMEAKIRGFEKYEELEEPVPPEECHHNVAAWHNVPHP